MNRVEIHAGVVEDKVLVHLSNMTNLLSFEIWQAKSLEENRVLNQEKLESEAS